MTSHIMQAFEPAHLPTWRGRPIPLTEKAIGEEIERLIELLDVIAGDSDVEDDGGTEPSLGWPDAQTGRGAFVMCEDVYLPVGERDQTDDREQESEHDEDNGDDESSLGWTEDPDQERRVITTAAWPVEDGEEDGDDLYEADGEVAGSGCHDDETEAKFRDLAEVARLYREATPKQQAAALALARQLAAEADGRDA